MISSDLLERLAPSGRIHGDLGLELGAMGAAFAHGWEPPLRGGVPPHRLAMDPVQKNQDHLTTAPEAQIVADRWRWEY